LYFWSDMPTVQQQLLTGANYVFNAFSGITNVGSTVITGGNIGSFPTSSITGIPGPGVLTPPAVIDNANSLQARLDALAAYNTFAALPFVSLGASSVNLSVSGNSGPSTYTPGNYSAGTSMDIPTSITLDAQGNANAIFIFKAGSTVTLESSASILLVNGANAANIVWLCGSSFTSIFAGVSVMNGTVLAQISATFGGGVLNGRALVGLGGSSGAVSISSALIATAPIGGGGGTLAPSNNCLISRNLGSSVLTAWPQLTGQGVGNLNLDLIQIVDQGGVCILNVDFAGTVHYPAVAPTNGVRLGQYYTRLNGTATLANLSLDTWTNNPAQEDIIQVINLGGHISYWLDYLLIAHGS
jgi:hypothetical protein